MTLFSTSDCKKLRKKCRSKPSPLAENAAERAKKTLSLARGLFKKKPKGSTESDSTTSNFGARHQPEQAGAVHGTNGMDFAVITAAATQQAVPVLRVDAPSFVPNSMDGKAVDKVFEHYWNLTDKHHGGDVRIPSAEKENVEKSQSKECKTEDKKHPHSRAKNAHDSGIDLGKDGNKSAKSDKQEKKDVVEEESIHDLEEGGVSLSTAWSVDDWAIYQKKTRASVADDSTGSSSLTSSDADDASSDGRSLSTRDVEQESTPESDTHGGAVEPQEAQLEFSGKQHNDSDDFSDLDEELKFLESIGWTKTPQPDVTPEQAQHAGTLRNMLFELRDAQFHEKHGIDLSYPPLPEKTLRPTIFALPGTPLYQGALEEWLAERRTPQSVEDYICGDGYDGDISEDDEDDETSSNYSVATVLPVGWQHQSALAQGAEEDEEEEDEDEPDEWLDWAMSLNPLVPGYLLQQIMEARKGNQIPRSPSPPPTPPTPTPPRYLDKRPWKDRGFVPAFALEPPEFKSRAFAPRPPILLHPKPVRPFDALKMDNHDAGKVGMSSDRLSALERFAKMREETGGSELVAKALRERDGRVELNAW